MVASLMPDPSEKLKNLIRATMGKEGNRVCS